VSPTIYKILTRPAWAAARAAGRFTGAAIDLQDGYIHFSTAAQAGETARRYFTGGGDLVILAVPAAALGPALRWEPSRGGDLFPHLYADLDCALITAVIDLPLADDGTPIMPDLAP
jgi:uncharacterized protein (DUF952 family)